MKEAFTYGAKIGDRVMKINHIHRTEDPVDTGLPVDFGENVNRKEAARADRKKEAITQLLEKVEIIKKQISEHHTFKELSEAAAAVDEFDADIVKIREIVTGVETKASLNRAEATELRIAAKRLEKLAKEKIAEAEKFDAHIALLEGEINSRIHNSHSNGVHKTLVAAEKRYNKFSAKNRKEIRILQNQVDGLQKRLNRYWPNY
ncbi:MAG: hypothetical protein ACFFFC_00710 [Candidatus Thorarchaeota archaeon]